MIIRTRFSPSPTGMIHLGNARTAIFSALYAKKNAGVFILRIEDTDATRSDERYVTSLQEKMHWLGVSWQEGPGVGGAYGPYWQSQRQDYYAKYYQLLEEKRLIYPCFCTDQELMLARKIQISRGLAPRYAGTCRQLSADEINQKMAAGVKPAWRFHVPIGKTIEFIDIVKGPQSFQSDDMGDFIVRRADGTAPFLFCNAIDDAMMEVTHVLRGEDHLSNTPRQIMLMQVMGLTVPSYGHLSLIVGDDGAPLSKRHGSFSVEEMQNQGYLPKAILNYLVRLGHIVDTQALLSFDDLAPYFHLDKLSRSPARFDTTQLLYWQNLAVQSLDAAQLWEWVGPEIEAAVPMDKRHLFAETVRNNISFPQDAAMWAAVFFKDPMAIDDEDLIRTTGPEFYTTALQVLEKHEVVLQDVLTEMKQRLGLNGKKLFMPLRMALTGKSHGPELVHVEELLGAAKIRQRLGAARQMALGGE